VPIRELVACGGLADKNPLLMQIYADVTGRPFKLSASDQTSALGSAMFAAVAAGAGAGGYATIADASRAMTRLKDRVFEPIPANRAVYDVLSGVRAPARLLRAGRERRDEGAQGPSGRGPDRQGPVIVCGDPSGACRPGMIDAHRSAAPEALEPD
jgi:hypothetical protein